MCPDAEFFPDVEAAPGFDNSCFSYDFDSQEVLRKIVDYSLKLADHVNYDTSIVPGEFIDGVLASPRTMSITPVAENELEVYISGEKSLILASQQVTLSDDPGIHFVYFNLSGILKESLIFDYKYFRSQPIVSLVYGNPTTQKLVDFADERHGITMDGFTHMYLHLTEGARYYNGMDIPGLVNGGLTHGVIGEGNLYDEDILQNCPPQADLPFIYLLGAGWDIKKDSNLLGYTVLNDTYISYNESVGGIHQLTEMTSPQDCTIMYIVATNNAVYPYMKLVGQYKYANASAARDAIADELAEISTYGLPSPEFVFVGAIILGRDGDLKILEDGSTFLDLREAKIRGASGGQSQEIVDHRSTTNRTAPDQHPTSAITGLDALLAGPILTAPDATRYKIVVSNDGTLSTVEV